jgi:hypothetical protein
MAEEKNAVTVESSRTVKLHDKNGNLHCEFEATDNDVMVRAVGQQGRRRAPVTVAQLEEAVAALKAK